MTNNTVGMIKEILEQVKTGESTLDSACQELHSMYYQDLGFAKIDHHRSTRQGFPEVIYCQGKTPEQVSEIFYHLSKKNSSVLATRASFEAYQMVREKVIEVEYNKIARTIMLRNPDSSTVSNTDSNINGGEVGVISAGTSDMPVAEEAYETAKIMGACVDRIYDVGVAGIHRILDQQSKLKDYDCIVVVAGMEGALASVVGGLVKVPIIGCPTSVGYGAHFNGLSSLLTMLNSCASGVSIVNIDNGFGAGYQAALIARVAVRVE